MTNQLTDVWKLETPRQDEASDYINYLFELALKGKTGARNLLKRIYEDNWETIKERMLTEGSVWYVWYMDGVNRLINIDARND